MKPETWLNTYGIKIHFGKKGNYLGLVAKKSSKKRALVYASLRKLRDVPELYDLTSPLREVVRVFRVPGTGNLEIIHEGVGDLYRIIIDVQTRLVYVHSLWKKEEVRIY